MGSHSSPEPSKWAMQYYPAISLTQNQTVMIAEIVLGYTKRRVLGILVLIKAPASMKAGLSSSIRNRVRIVAVPVFHIVRITPALPTGRKPLPQQLLYYPTPGTATTGRSAQSPPHPLMSSPASRRAPRLPQCATLPTSTSLTPDVAPSPQLPLPLLKPSFRPGLPMPVSQLPLMMSASLPLLPASGRPATPTSPHKLTRGTLLLGS